MIETAFLYQLSAGDVAIASIVLFITFSLWACVFVTVVRREKQ